MSCIETGLLRAATRRGGLLTLTGLLVLAGCAQRQASTSAPRPTSTSATATAPAPAATGPRVALARDWDDWRRQAAQRLVQANPNGSYMGLVKQPLLAIPVLEVELNGDGSIRNVTVSRKPGQAPETLQMAIDAMRRSGPFPPVSHLPKPWKYTEVFLFNEERRFKPRTLDD